MIHPGKSLREFGADSLVNAWSECPQSPSVLRFVLCFSSAQLRAIVDIIATALAQERAQNQVPPSLSNQTFSPAVEESGSVNAIRSGLPEELVLAEAELEQRMCAMLNIWDDCSNEEEVERKPVKVEIEKSITVQVGEVPDNEDEQIQLAIQKSSADQADQWYYSSDEDRRKMQKKLRGRCWR
ncbi:hypothetical protein JCGZ_24412 [Jatropha curcas]|uniref:Uncharacterized protein n=1 Tax=Jatropha curcas TaxID=180498 RepID=A0A067JLQ8_JATCU|nr:hypothetical protein JCGZ_24412 [Jatropha curcas]